MSIGASPLTLFQGVSQAAFLQGLLAVGAVAGFFGGTSTGLMVAAVAIGALAVIDAVGTCIVVITKAIDRASVDQVDEMRHAKAQRAMAAVTSGSAGPAAHDARSPRLRSADRLPRGAYVARDPSSLCESLGRSSPERDWT